MDNTTSTEQHNTAPPTPPPEVFDFTFDPSLEPWNMVPRAWLAKNDKHYDGLAVSAVVFDDQDRVLLVQRAANDSMPNRWEVPGGAADDERRDKDNGDRKEEGDSARNPPKNPKFTILSSAARELWEEAGLIATRFTHLVPQPEEAPLRGATEAPKAAYPDHQGFIYRNRTREVKYLRFAFHVQVKSTANVVLDPKEHQAYVWATEEEVREGVMDRGHDIPATVPATRSYILEAFRLRALQASKQ